MCEIKPSCSIVRDDLALLIEVIGQVMLQGHNILVQLELLGLSVAAFLDHTH